MKRKLLAGLTATLLLAAILVPGAAASGAIKAGDVVIGTSNDVQMVGTIEPTIMSVTIPSYVPFNLVRSLDGENKVISPRITIVNKSRVPVALDVVYTNVDLSKLGGTTWSNGVHIGDNQIGIGFQQELTPDVAPTNLDNTMWLQTNSNQQIRLMDLAAAQSGSMYVVGSIGINVPESNTFSVTPTFVVRQATAFQ